MRLEYRGHSLRSPRAQDVESMDSRETTPLLDGITIYQK